LFCDNIKEICPVFPGRAARIHQSFEDPPSTVGDYESRMKIFRRVRDEICEWLKIFVGEQSSVA
jgi:arsenate reductase